MSSEEPSQSSGSSSSDEQVSASSPETSGAVAPALWQNYITTAGMLLTALSVLLLISFLLLSLIRPASNQYIDVVGYMMLPGLLLFGLFLMPLGILIKSWRERRHDPRVKLTFRFPKINLADPNQRRWAGIISLLMFISVPMAGISSYQGYHYSDSRQFCASACHEVMEPQAVTHAISAHARIGCTECHVGSGAAWTIHYKVAGARQAFSFLRGTYERPIPVAIDKLRPSRDTCEECHWPERFFDSQLRTFTHYAADEKNTVRNIKMMLKTGGADGRGGRIEGIHKHMLDLGTVEFIAVDDKLQDIPWVKWTDMDGRERIYRSDGEASSAPPPEGRHRQMDCMDCHNRTGHNFLSGDEAVNVYMRVGKIDATLPFIKREAMTALRDEGSVAITQDKPDIEAGGARIEKQIIDFYRSEYPKHWESGESAVRKSADMVATIYGEEWFPKMKAHWRDYPDNSGHFVSPGCLRCHDGKHMDSAGEPISHRCTLCHTYVTRFEHPMELDAAHTLVRCDQCHSGGLVPPPTCTGCHAKQVGFISGQSPEFARFQIEADGMASMVGCGDCHDTSERASLDAMNDACMDCHEDEEERFDGMVLEWKREIDGLLEAAESSAAGEDLKLLNALRSAGPLHNMEATRSILHSLEADSQ